MQVVILAGGLATRMKPLTENFPKALLSVGGTPFIDHQLKHLRTTGATSIVLCIGFRGEMIREYVGDGSTWGLNVSYVDEGEELKGTAGALRLAADQGVLEDQFLITYGDSYLPIGFLDVWKSFLDSGKPAVMSVYKNNGAYDQSNVWFENGEIKIYDKFATQEKSYSKNIEHIDYGLTGLKKSVVLEKIPSGKKFDLAQVFHELSIEGRLAGYESHKRFYEIGSPEGLKELDQVLGCGSFTKVIILDRDGVLNRMRMNEKEGALDSPLTAQQVEVFDHVPGVIKELTDAGIKLYIATNQPAAKKGKTTSESLQKVHEAIVQACESKGGKISGSEICFDLREENSRNRKPAPGMLLKILRENPLVNSDQVWMVGDRETDIEAGMRAGVRTAYLGVQNEIELRAGFVGKDLKEFWEWLKA